eukprot:Rmarinus@m.418
MTLGTERQKCLWLILLERKHHKKYKSILWILHYFTTTTSTGGIGRRESIAVLLLKQIMITIIVIILSQYESSFLWFPVPPRTPVYVSERCGKFTSHSLYPTHTCCTNSWNLALVC